MFLLRIVSCFAILIFTLLSTSAHADSNSGVCLLLKQQMERFADTKTHPSYRKASRDYRKQCVDKPPTQKAIPQTTTEKSPQNNAVSSNDTVDVLTAKPDTNFDDQQVSKPTQADQQTVESTITSSVESSNEQVQPTTETPTQQTTEAKETQDVVTADVQEKNKASNPVAKPQIVTPAVVEFEAPKANIPWLALIAVVLLLGLLIAMRVFKDKFDKLKSKSKVLTVSIGKAAEQAKENAKEKARRKNELDPEIYFSFHKLEVETEAGKKVVIDRVILSHFGIFVVHYQKQRGAIMGSATQPQWNEQVGQDKIPFDNPITVVNQASHAVARILSLSNEIETVVTFNDMAQFKSQLPIIVMQRKDLVKYINGFKELRHSDDVIDEMVATLDGYIAKQKADKLAQEQAEIERQLAEVSLRQQQQSRSEETPDSDVEDDPAEQGKTQYPEPGSYLESLNEVDNLPSYANPNAQTSDEIEHKESIYHSISEQAESALDLDTLTQQAADDLNAQSQNEEAFETSKLQEGDLSSMGETIANNVVETASPEQSNDLEFNLNSEYKSESGDLQSGDLTIQPPSLDVTAKNEEPERLNQTSSEAETLSSNELEDQLKARFDFPDLSKEAPWLDLKSEDENTVSHSEFKRRAAKKAAEKSGMFDYLDHYSRKSDDTRNDEPELDFEAELEQSLAAGKGFLDEIEAVTDESKFSTAPSGSVSENSDVSDDEQAEFDESLYAKNDVYASNTYNPSESDLSKLDAQLDSGNNHDEQGTASSWRKLAEQETDESVSLSVEPELTLESENTSGSSWRKLAEQETDDSLSLSVEPELTLEPENTSGSSWRKLAEQEADDSLSLSVEPELTLEPENTSGSSWRKLAEQEADDSVSLSVEPELTLEPENTSGSSWRKLAEQEAGAQSKDEPEETEKKANPFANLSLDPDWGPKEPPKNTYSALDDIDSEIPIPDSTKKPR